MSENWKAFDKKWFNKHQGKILWLLNAPVIKHVARKILRIRKYDCPINENINRIEPNAFWFGAVQKGENVEVTVDFRTHNKYSKRIYFAFKWVWWTMHAWDWLVADRLVPKLSFGFSTLTVYSGSAGAQNPVDGYISYAVRHQTWATVQGASNATTVDYTDNGTAKILTDNVSGEWYNFERAFYDFDTSALTTLATISAAVLSIAGIDSGDDIGSSVFDIVSNTVTSTTALATTDYPNVGTTSFGNIAVASWAAAYNDITLNASGIANISKTAKSKFGGRMGQDRSNTTPTWPGAFKGTFVRGRFSDNAGTTNDPKLVVTYSTVSGPANLKSYNTNVSANIKSIDTNLLANIKSLDTNV